MQGMGKAPTCAGSLSQTLYQKNIRRGLAACAEP